MGAGPAGLTVARCFAESGHEVHVYDKRDHIGGNCYDCQDTHGILIHPYGPHFFRTDSLDLLQWLSKFTDWRPAQYIVKAKVGEELIPLPVSLSTMIQLHGKFYNKKEFKKHLKSVVIQNSKPANAKEQCLNKMGQELYQSIFEGYTKKQWGIDASELDPSVTARIPIRYDYDERYPSEKYQIIPRHGYTKMFEAIASHSNITLHLNHLVDHNKLLELKDDCNKLIYTGPIDEYFNHQLGKLDYRSLHFDWVNYPMNFFQSCSSINYPNDYDYTRTVEIKHLTGQQCDSTSICYEYPQDSGEPFYPVLTERNKDLLSKYQRLALQEKKTHFLGRLAEYRYYNMDHIFIRALKFCKVL